MLKKIIISSLIVFSSAIGFVALAQTPSVKVDANAGVTVIPTVVSAHEVTLQVGAKGNTTLKGTVSAVSSNAFTVKSWGGDWTVNVSGTTEVVPVMENKNAAQNLAQFKVGDFVGVNGTINQNASWTIDAKLVRNRTQQTIATMQEKEGIKKKKDMEKEKKAKNYKGTASNVAATSFTLTSEKATYTVTIDAKTKLMNKIKSLITATDVQNGDTVKVFGQNVNGAITATVISDLSIPRKTNP